MSRSPRCNSAGEGVTNLVCASGLVVDRFQKFK